MHEGSKKLRRLGFAAVFCSRHPLRRRWARPARPAVCPRHLATAGSSIPLTASASMARGFAASPPS